MVLSDNETKIDLLNYEAIAKTIVELLRERPDHPITIGVHGDWGAGKSSILEMIEAGLEHEDKVLCLKVNVRLPRLLRQTVKTLLTVRCKSIVPHPGTVLG